MQVANLNQLVQNALQELDYLSKDFVCSGLWCSTTGAAYKRFLLDENVDPHFAGVQPAEASHLPKTLFDYIFGSAEAAVEQAVEAVEDAAGSVVDLIAPGSTVIVNIGELSEGKSEQTDETVENQQQQQQTENNDREAEDKPKDTE